MNEIDGFIEFIREIQIHPVINYQNNLPEHQQSSVAMIFRISPQFQKLLSKYQSEIGKLTSFNEIKDYLQPINYIQDSTIDLLFMQRQENKKDRHSGQICFPGGKCDQQETDYQTVIRECIEEIGIDLQQNSLYLGKIFKNFLAYPYKEGHMFISVHIFLVVQEVQFNLSSSEVKQVAWIQFNQVIAPDIDHLFYLKWVNTAWIRYVQPQSLQKLFQNSFQYNQLTAIQIKELDAPLFGLTYGIVQFVACIIYYESNNKKQHIYKQIKNHIQFAAKQKKIFKYNYIQNNPFLQKYFKSNYGNFKYVKKEKAKL